jgi:ribosomal protein L12E/L44/L45/RPP1/RPP2
MPPRRTGRCRATRGHDGALPTEDDVRRILGSVGAEVEVLLDLLFALMEGKDITRFIAAGR